jgi:hypothetical protein
VTLSESDRERVSRATDHLDEALDELGLHKGVPLVRRAYDLLNGVEGVEPVRTGSEDVADLRHQLPAGRRALERRDSNRSELPPRGRRA